MSKLHPHAAALDAIGRGTVQSHYKLSDTGWRGWRKTGVPAMHWKSLRLLALVNDKPLPEFGESA